MKKHFVLINNDTNVGQSESINLAIENVHSDLVMILNDDDYLYQDIVEVMLFLFNKYRQIYLIGSHCTTFENDQQLLDSIKLISDVIDIDKIELKIQTPEMAANYTRVGDLNMTHSGSTFLRGAFYACGKYRSKKKDRLVLGSDRDFQLRLNALFPVGVSYEIPFVFWRTNSSVDSDLFS
jgi:hypothetical protein